MTTIGMRLLFGWLTTAALLAVGFGAVHDSWQAFVGTLSALIALGFLAGIVTMDRDFDAIGDAVAAAGGGHDATDGRSDADTTTPSASWWPFAASIGAAIVVVGLAVDAFLVGFGAVLVSIAVVGWAIAAARDRSTGLPIEFELPLLVRDVPHLGRWVRALDVLAIVLLTGLADGNMSAVLALAILTAVAASHAAFSWALDTAEHATAEHATG